MIEYLRVDSHDPMTVDELAPLGRDGWELCGMLRSGGVIVHTFRRLQEHPLQPAEPALLFDTDLESPEKRLERRRFKIGTWLRNLLWGAAAPGVYVLRRAREAGFEESEIREVARLIQVDMEGAEWVYRGF
jgi:hypothetical protein